MGIALLSAERSKDPNRQVGACIVNSDKKVVGVGYNSMPYGCSDNEFPWGREDLTGSIEDKKFYGNNRYQLFVSFLGIKCEMIFSH